MNRNQKFGLWIMIQGWILWVLSLRVEFTRILDLLDGGTIDFIFWEASLAMALGIFSMEYGERIWKTNKPHNPLEQLEKSLSERKRSS